MKRARKILAITVSILMVFSLFQSGITVSAYMIEGTEGYYRYRVYEESKTAEIVSCDKSISGDVEIPDTLGGYPVTRIADKAFSYCNKLLSIVFPDSIISMGEEVFYYCALLESVDIPYGITEIGNRTFYYCNSLKNIVIPESVKSISYNAFSDCWNLTSLIIPNSVTEIRTEAFSGCKSLTHITLSNNITGICDKTFKNCHSLLSIYIPENVTAISNEAFYNCEKIKNIYFEGNKEQWADIYIGLKNDCLKKATVYYNCTEIPIDISGDGELNAEDLVVMRCALLSGENKNNTFYDINGDGSSDIKDLVSLKKKIAGIE